MASDADREQSAVPTAHRITWFGVERPVDGATVFVKPPATEPDSRTSAAADTTS